jgi:tetratricopeptide (TPR) repeat protein
MKRSIFAIMLAGLVFLTGFGIAVLSISRPAPVDARAMTAANKLVAAGHYAEAAQMYEQQIAQGAQDAALYYNLGNATLLLGDTRRAVAAYEQAAVLAPRDADIRANLAVAQQTRGPSNGPSAGPLGSLAGATVRWLTIDELALLSLIAWLALGLLVLAYRSLRPGQRPSPVRVSMAVLLLIVFATGVGLAGRIAAPRLAAVAAIAGQPPASIAGNQAADPASIPHPS